MSIEIIVKNVNRNFTPHTQALKKLLKVTEKLYRTPVTFQFEIATQYRVDAESRVIPLHPVTVTVSYVGTSPAPAGDHYAEVAGINQKIQDLLVFSGVEELNLPASVLISDGIKEHRFLGSEAAKVPEWR